MVHYEVRTPEDVLSALIDSSRKALEIVAVNGGDGTIQAVLTALFHHEALCHAASHGDFAIRDHQHDFWGCGIKGVGFDRASETDTLVKEIRIAAPFS